MYRIRISDHIECAHFSLIGTDENDPRRRVHGHSYYCEIELEAAELDQYGVLTDIDAVKAKFAEVLKPLDHTILNEIPGLERPSMELLGKYIYDHLIDDLPALKKVIISRPSLGYAAEYEK